MSNTGEGEQAPPHDAGSDHPQFIIAVDGKFYLTLSVWAYDPGHPQITEEQRVGVARVAEEYARLAREGWARKAVQLPPLRADHEHGADFGLSAQHTH